MVSPVDTMLPFEDDGRDGSAPEAEESFRTLDPGWDDPGYWNRFQERTLARVETELARRRRALEGLTVSDVVTSWSRTVVPVAMAAAAVAVMVLWNQPGEGGGDVRTAPSTAQAPAAPVRSVADTEGEAATEAEPSAPALDGGTVFTLEEPGPADMSVTLMASVEAF